VAVNVNGPEIATFSGTTTRLTNILPPTGDCPILYNECNFAGTLSERFCGENPRTNI